MNPIFYSCAELPLLTFRIAHWRLSRTEPSGKSALNYALLKAAHLDRDDVYQALAMRLIRAVEQYAPHNSSGKSLKGYIFMNPGYEMHTCGGTHARYGFREAPFYLPNAVISMEALEEADPYWEMRIAA